MQNEANCSSNPSQPPPSTVSTAPPNAFTPEFLKALEAREDAPLAALETEMVWRQPPPLRFPLLLLV